MWQFGARCAQVLVRGEADRVAARLANGTAPTPSPCISKKAIRACRRTLALVAKYESCARYVFSTFQIVARVTKVSAYAESPHRADTLTSHSKRILAEVSDQSEKGMGTSKKPGVQILVDGLNQKLLCLSSTNMRRQPVSMTRSRTRQEMRWEQKCHTPRCSSGNSGNRSS